VGKKGLDVKGFWARFGRGNVLFKADSLGPAPRKKNFFKTTRLYEFPQKFT
jgi:hypothetical protein